MTHKKEVMGGASGTKVFVQRKWGVACEREHHRCQVHHDQSKLMVLFDFNIWIRRNTGNANSGGELVRRLLQYMEQWKDAKVLVVVCDQADSTPIVKSFEQAHRDYRITQRGKWYELPPGRKLADVFNEHTAPCETVIGSRGLPIQRGAIDTLINNRELRDDAFKWILQHAWEKCNPEQGCTIVFSSPKPDGLPLRCSRDNNGNVVRDKMAEPMNTGEGDVGLLAWCKHPDLRVGIKTVYLVSLDGDMIPICLTAMCSKDEFDENGFVRQFYLELTYPGSWWDREKDASKGEFKRSGQVPVVMNMTKLYTCLDSDWRVKCGVHRPIHVFAYLTCVVGNDYVQELKGIPAEYLFNLCHELFHRLNHVEQRNNKRLKRDTDCRRLIKRKFIEKANTNIYAGDERLFVMILRECVARWDEFSKEDRGRDAWGWRTLKQLEKFLDGPQECVHSVHMRSLWCVNYMCRATARMVDASGHTSCYMENVIDPIGTGFGWEYNDANQLYIEGYETKHV